MAGYVIIQGGQMEYDEAIGGLGDQAHRVLFVSWVREQRPVAGLRRFVVDDALKRLPGPWNEDMVVRALEELEAAGLAVWDREARLLFLRPALEHDRLRGANSVKGAAASVRELPDSPALIPALSYLAREAELAGGEDMEALAGGLRLRLETIRSPFEGGSEGRPNQAQPPLKGVHGVDNKLSAMGNSTPVSIIPGRDGEKNLPSATPSEGGTRARVSQSQSQAPFPPKPPLSRPGGLWGKIGLGRKGGEDGN